MKFKTYVPCYKQVATVCTYYCKKNASEKADFIVMKQDTHAGYIRPLCSLLPGSYAKIIIIRDRRMIHIPGKMMLVRPAVPRQIIYADSQLLMVKAPPNLISLTALQINVICPVATTSQAVALPVPPPKCTRMRWVPITGLASAIHQ